MPPIPYHSARSVPPERCPRHLVDRLKQHSQTSARDVAYRFLEGDDENGRLVTYDELSARVCAIAARLRSAEATGQRVLIVQSPGPEYVASLFACWYAGAVAVPSHPPLWNRADGRLAAIAQDCGARFALTTAAWLDRLKGGGTGPKIPDGLTWIATDTVPDQEGSGFIDSDIESGSVALLQYTSGSTSSPKGVVLTHAHFENNIGAFVERAGLTASDRVVSWLPPHHDLGLITGILLPVYLGLEATIMPPSTFLRRPHAWLQAISRFRATASGGPNFAYELCVRRVSKAQREALDLRSWRLAISGAERVRAGTLERFAATFAESGFQRNALRPTYGLAEATLGVSLDATGATAQVMSANPADLGQGRATPAATAKDGTPIVGCGAPLPGFEVLVVDPETRTALPSDSVGEIWVRSDSVASGYWGRPDLTEATFGGRLSGDSGEGPYLRTGDLGFLSRGEVFVTGRLKDLLILAGANHHPDDIEATVEGSHVDLRAAGAAAFSIDVNGEERLVIVQELSDPGKGLDEAYSADIAATMRDAVARAHDLPVHEIVFASAGSIPRTSSGKLRRGSCRGAYLDGTLDILARIPAGKPEIRATPEMVSRVAAMMADVLGVDSIGPEEDFFALGGHSLMATQLVSRVRATMNVELPLRLVFESPNASALAAQIERLPQAEVLASIERIDRAGPLPLSFSQERMWFLHRVDPSSSAYNVAGALAIAGPLDYNALERAITELAVRHEILRTNYPVVDGVPHAVIASLPQLSATPIDLSEEADPQARGLALAEELARAPFDLADGQLARFALYRLSPNEHLLAASMHHMITDAWAMGVLMRELFQLYFAFERGEPPPPRAVDELGYLDYAAWQRKIFAQPRLADDLAYWKEALRGLAPLEIPADRARTARRSSLGALEPLHLSVTLRDEVRALGAEHGVTQFMILLAGFAVVLARHAQQWDFAVGVPVANRNHLASESLIGTLVNTLPVRVPASPELSFTDLLARVRQVALDAYAHQDLPFERLVAELNVARVAGQSPLVQVMFDYQNAPTPAQDAGSLRITPVLVERGAAQFDLSLVVFDTSLGHTALIEYATDLFDAATIRRILGHYVQVLQSVVANPHQSLAQIPLLMDEERAAILARASGDFTIEAARESPARLFENIARRSPSAPAVHDAAGTLTYDDLNRRSAALAAHLRRRGIGPGDRVVVMLDRSAEVVVALLAVAKVGAAYVPIDPRYPPERIAFVLEDAAPKLVLTQSRLRGAITDPRAAGSAAEILCLDADPTLFAEASAGAAPPAVSDPALPAYVLYTSGSTGHPKGVVVSIGALTNFLRSMGREPGLRAGDRLLSVTTIAFDISGLELWLPLITGASVFVAPGDVVADGVKLRALIEHFAPTMMQATPATWRLLIEAGWSGAAGLSLLCGGEALPRDLADALLARAGSVWNMYGPTETTIWSSLHRVTPGEGPVPIGRPIDRTRIVVLDGHGALAPFGVAGEIVIGGDGVAQEYLKRPELNAERFVADPFTAEKGARMYRTGDLGCLRADGTLYHLGRLDQQIKLRGFRIEPGEIEAALEAAGAKQSVVVLREDQPGNSRLVAYYVASASTPTVAELLEQLRTQLPPHMLPSAYVLLAELPLTPNGKIDRKALPAPDLASVPDRDYVAPRDELESALARLWSEVLGVAAPSIRDDFFALGGHSLLAVRLLARVASEHHVDLPLRTLLDDPTIESLTARIRDFSLPATGRAEQFVHLVPVREQGDGAPLICIHGAGGHVLNMSAIARHMSPKLAFIGMQARGTDGISEPHSSIEDMAAAYLAELRVIQPNGPYYLSGYCGGGLVAFEMARILQEQGQQVPLLALIDTYRPGSVRRLPPWRHFWRRIAEGPRSIAKRAVLGVRRDALAATRRIAIAYHRYRGQPMPHELRDPWLTWDFLKAADKYHTGRRVFRGQLHVLRAREVDPDMLIAEPDLGWRGLASDGIKTHEISGTHDVLSEEPHVAEVGAALQACMELTR
jgi:amino acid adenylation domain-containing protein